MQADEQASVGGKVAFMLVYHSEYQYPCETLFWLFLALI